MEGIKGLLILSCCFGIDCSKDKNMAFDQILVHKVSDILVHSSVLLCIFRDIIILVPLISLTIEGDCKKIRTTSKHQMNFVYISVLGKGYLNQESYFSLLPLY